MCDLREWGMHCICVALVEQLSRSRLEILSVRSLNAWSLLVDQAMFSCALPATIMDGHLNEQIAFPAWFGKFSAANKRQRLMRELALHAHLGISGSNHALVVDYLPVLRDRLYRPLVEKDPAVAVKQVLEVYKSYNLVREDTEAINELGVWPNRKDIVQLVPTKSKSALTRALNKEPRSLPFAQKSSAVVKGRKKEAKVGDDKSSGSDSGKEDVDEVNEEEELF
uniref:DNA replication factor RFC1 C-terminal domain-containing protein n=1 Tax=Ditylenchus dipsaci TaxID=166011 RepID=A0A915E704_9BILA